MNRVPDAVLFGHIRTGKQLYRKFFFCLNHLAIPEVGAIVGVQGLTGLLHLERVKMALGIVENVLHGGTLGQQLGMGRRKSECFLTLDHRLSQPHGNGDNSLVGLHAGKRVVIV